MTSKPPGACCVSGRELLSGETGRGEIKTIDGIETYIVHSPSNASNQKAILFLSDACGIVQNYSQRLADSIADQGYLVVMPDQFHGDPHPYGSSPGVVDLYVWLARHTTDRVDPVIERMIKYIRDDCGFRSIGAVAYCFGAKYLVRHLRDGRIDAGYVAHPSFVTSKELGAITKPLSIAAAETDEIFTDNLRHESERILKGLDVQWQICLYSDVEHSFATRGNPEVRREMWAKEEALLQAFRWFKEHLPDS